MKFLTTFFCAFLCLHVHAQGWDRTLTDSLKVISVAPTSDNGCVLLGRVNTLNKTTVLKVDANGKTEWIKQYDGYPQFDEPVESGRIRIRQDSDGNYWFHVTSYVYHTTLITKLDKVGNRIKYDSIKINNAELHIIDNQPLLFGFIPGNGTPQLLRLNSIGNVIDTKNISGFRLVRGPYYNSYLQKNGIIISSNSDTTASQHSATRIGLDGIVKSRNALSNTVSSLFLLGNMIALSDGGYLIPDSNSIIKIDSLGKFVWRKSTGIINRVPGFPFMRHLYAAKTVNGEFIGLQQNATKSNLDIRRFATDGSLQSSHAWFYSNNLDNPFIIKMAKGGFLVVGNTQGTKVKLIKLDENGYVFSNFIKGNIFSDRDLNCRLSGNDLPIQRVIVQAKRTGLPDILALTDTLGKYNMNVDIGTYTVGIVNPNKYMEPCIPSVLKTISALNTLDSVDFALKSNFFCGLMQVDIATPRLRRCFNNNYTVSYCNKGTAMAMGAYLNITLDSLLEFVTADKPVASKTGRTYRFNLGNIDINDCKNFDIVARVRCGDST